MPKLTVCHRSTSLHSLRLNICRLFLYASTAAALMIVLVAPEAHSQAAQTGGRISGTVTDSASGQPIGAVRVSAADGRYAATTNEQGTYLITGVPAGSYSLEARRIGYRPRMTASVVVTEGATTTVNFGLSTALLNLMAVVTTGVVDPTSGTRVPFTVGRVDAENMPIPSTNALESIQGKLAGVRVVPSGQPGSGTNILLRSPTSINKSNSPLIVVDGVIQSQAFGSSSADLESIDIESVEVIKGAAAASLYGSRAASGVIQIRTRRGATLAEGVTRFGVRSEIGTNSLANTIDWARYHFYATNEAGEYVNSSGDVVPRSQRVAKPVYERFQDEGYISPIYDQVDRFFDPGQFYKNSFSVGQNSGKSNWFLGVANSREDGVVLNSGRYNQNDGRINLDHRASNRLLISVSAYHSQSKRNELYGDTFFDLINQAPDVDLRVADPDGTPYLFQGDPDGREENPLYVLATEDNKRYRNRTQASLSARLDPFQWMKIDADANYDRSDRRLSFFLDQGLKTEGFALGGPGEISETTGTTGSINASISMNLLGTIGLATVRSTFRAIMEREKNEVTSADGENLSAPGVRSLDNAQTRFVSSSTEEIRATGYFASVAADYDGKLIGDVLLRRDGSSLFGPGEQWNNYYRVSGAYRIGSEPWWPFPDVTEFKLRASQGTAGTRPSFDDQFETFSFNSAGGLQKQNLGNRFLKPEHATETEVGIDAVYQDRYSFQLSYAKSEVVDQLIQIPLAGFYGYLTQWQNAGTVEGNTLEATVEAVVMNNDKMNWRVGLVADKSRNEVTKFNRSCFVTQTIAFRCANESLGSMYGFRFIKAASELPETVGTRINEFAVNDEGLLVWVGLDGTGAPNAYTEGQTKQLWGTTATIGSSVYNWGTPITARDSTGSSAVIKIGDGNPDFHWALSNHVSFGNFSAYALLDAQVGGEIYNQTNQRMYQYGRSADVDQAGKPQELKKPVEYYVALYAANSPTDYFVEPGGFVKLREVMLRYRLSGSTLNLLSRAGISDASISLIGRNLLTFTDYKGYDPEVGNTLVRLDSFDYPRYRTITGSIEIIF